MRRRRFGSFLVSEGFIDARTLGRALAYQSWLRSRRIGEVLADMGFVRATLLDTIYARQMQLHDRVEGERPMPFGRFMVSEGYIEPSALEAAVKRQQLIRSLRIGEVLVEMHELSRTELDKAVRLRLEELAVA